MRNFSLILIYLFVFSCEDKVEKDKLPPELTIVYPKSGETLMDTVKVQVETKDNEGISHVEFYINDSLHYTDSTYTYEYNWPTIDHEDGEYFIKAVSIDYSGNRIEKAVNVVVNNALMFVKSFDNGSFDYCSSVVQTLDGGYIFTGYIDNKSNSKDLWLVKTDSRGIEAWSKIIGGPNKDGGEIVRQINDGGYIIGGFTNSYGQGDLDGWLIKTSPNGSVEWENTFGGKESDGFESFQITKDGGFILIGSTESIGNGGPDVWLVKTNSNGEMEWEKTFGGSEYDFGLFVQQTVNGGYIISGLSEENSNIDAWLIKTDSKGVEEWSRRYGGENHEIGEFVYQTTDNGFIIVGYTQTWERYYGWSVKFDSLGNIIWEKIIQVSGSDGIDLYGANVTDDGFVITGTAVFFRNDFYDYDYLLGVYDSNGNEKWLKTFGNSNFENGKSVQQTSDGGFIITGYSNVTGEEINGSLIKTDVDGNTVPFK